MLEKKSGCLFTLSVHVKLGNDVETLGLEVIWGRSPGPYPASKYYPLFGFFKKKHKCGGQSFSRCVLCLDL